MSHEVTKFSQEQIDLMKNTICKGSTNDEFELFLYACQRTGLDPFLRQIHAVKRWDASLGKNVMAIQTGIDGYRLIAERTGKYMPGKECTYVYDNSGRIFSCTAYVKKLGPDGVWHEISHTVFFTEYAALKKDGTLTGMWNTKQHIMISKCAEAACLRKVFPAEMSGIYTKEEMEQADNPVKPIAVPIPECTISHDQVAEIMKYLCDDQEALTSIVKIARIESLDQLPVARYAKCLAWAKQRSDERMEKEMAMTSAEPEPQIITMDEVLKSTEVMDV